MGRHLTTFLVTNQLCSKVRVVDKVPPATAWLNEEHKVRMEGAVGGGKNFCVRCFLLCL